VNYRGWDRFSIQPLPNNRNSTVVMELSKRRFE
jgi:hypothetical protein